MKWKVYGTCCHLLWVDGGATPPLELGDGVNCRWCDGTTRVASIEAANP